MNAKVSFNKNSAYYKLLQSVKNGSEPEVEKHIRQIRKEFPVLVIDKFSPSAIYILDYLHQNYGYMSSSVESIIGYPAEDFYKHGIAFTFSIIHPDDALVLTGKITQVFLNKLHTISPAQLNHYRFSWNYRARRKDGKYIQILQQLTVALVDENRNPLLYVGTTSDISAFKTNNSIVFSVSKFDPDKKHFKEIENLLFASPNPLSQRETQILKWIVGQKTNEEIASICNISVHTVRAHRRKIHEKMKCKTISAAISVAQSNQWI